MTELGDKIVIDCSIAQPPDPEAIAAMEADAMGLLRGGDLEGARNVLDQIERVRAEASEPRETREPLSDDERALREQDHADERQRVIRRLRAERDELLRRSDWSQLPDVGLGDQAIAAWRRYRQALRDWPASVADPFNPPPWPDPPGGG